LGHGIILLLLLSLDIVVMTAGGDLNDKVDLEAEEGATGNGCFRVA
jgi:hypothetical protein|tara:strand:- start:540 stop:677 length:138 start_codon:yes stop_codon:yes gene_type:complete